MSVYSPKPAFSKDDRQLVSLLSSLLLEHLDPAGSTANLPREIVAISDRQAEELVNLLEKIVNTRKFVETARFVEGISDTGPQSAGNLREIYLSNRRRLGRSRAVASGQWRSFLVRLGLNKHAGEWANTEPMSIGHFLQMEEKLFASSSLHPRVRKLLIEFLRERSDAVSLLRAGHERGRIISIKQCLLSPFAKLRRSSPIGIDQSEISATRIAAALVMVTDMSVMFSTRDWSVAGTLSTFLGALSQTITPDKK